MKDAEANLARQKALYEKERGNKAYNDEKFEEAIKLYSLAISYDKNQPTLFCNRAMAYIKMNKFDEAKLDCDQAIQLDVAYSKAYFRRGLCYNKFKDFDSALADFRRVLQLEPGNKEAKSSLENLQKVINKSDVKENLLVEPILVDNIVGSTNGMKKVTITMRNKTGSPPHETDTTATSTTIDIAANPADEVDQKQSEFESQKLLPQNSAFQSSILNEPPKSAFQFLNVWRCMRDQPLLFCNYLLTIQISEYANVVDSCLEPDLISDILSSYCYYTSNCACSEISTEQCRRIFESLSALCRLQHFSTTKLFFDDTDFINLKRISNFLATSANIKREDLCDLEKRFKK